MNNDKIDFIADFFTYENIPKIHIMTINYFGKETINKLFLHKLKNIYEKYPSIYPYHTTYPSFTVFLEKSGYKKIPIIENLFWGFLLCDMGYGMKSDSFEIPTTAQKVIDKYWTKECEIEYKKYLTKYGFFCFRGFFNKLREIIGRETYKQFYNMIKKTKEGGPSNIDKYLGSLRFSWGLKPEIIVKKCKYCGEEFIPIFDLVDSILGIEEVYTQIKSINDINFCRYHILPYYYSDVSNPISKSKEKMIDLLKKLIAITSFILPSNFKRDFSYLKNIDKEKFDEAIILLNDIPDYQYYKEDFGSWFKTLIAANVLEEDTRKMSRGYMCLAEDGHECLSLGEKNIDDWLYRHNIEHEKEPRYPGEGNFRADWKVKNYFVEYWGLKGQEDYDNKILLKREITKEYNIDLIEINPDDLNNLNEILKILLKKDNLRRKNDL